MTDRPAREGADRVERRLKRLFDGRGLVRHGGHDPEQVDEGALLPELPADPPQRHPVRLDLDLLIVSAHGTTPYLFVRDGCQTPRRWRISVYYVIPRKSD